MKVFFSVGEPSGDLHGANLIRQLQHRRPDIECVGYGGPRMAGAGCHIDVDLTQFAVMWFARVLAHIPTFWNLLVRADRYFQHHRPDAVVLIDYPGFNWWIARRAKAHGIPVFYYGVPQLWAWAGWRVRKMRRFVDHVLCKLPFEESWYRERGCHATYVGHPYFDELEARQLDASCLESLTSPVGPLVTLLPGSRNQEVSSNLNSLLQAAHRIRARVPDARFAVAAFKSSQAARVRKILDATDLPISVWVGKTPELIHAATCCMAVSGSVSLELLYHAKPSVILYQISRPAYWVQGFFRQVKFITLVNLLAMYRPTGCQPPPLDACHVAGEGRSAGALNHALPLSDDNSGIAEASKKVSSVGDRPGSATNRTHARYFLVRAAGYDPLDPDDAEVPMPEYLTCDDKSEQIANHVIEWLTDPEARRKRIEQLQALAATIGCGGASRTAAEYILGAVTDQPAVQARSRTRHVAA